MSWNDLWHRFRRRFGRERDDVVVTPGTGQLPDEQAALATPAIDVYEGPNDVMVVADVPGGRRDHARVTWQDHRLELLVEPWYRVVELPHRVDPAAATAALRDGVLTVRIPKQRPSSRLIPIVTTALVALAVAAG
jgi:HSP20 family molecular chaperone IbpA